MSSGDAVAVVTVVFCGVYVVLGWRAYRLISADRVEWRRRWTTVDISRRQEILRHLRDGRSVEGREDGELALLALDRFDFVRSTLRPITLAFALFLAVLLVLGVVLGLGVPIVIGIAGLAGVGSLERSTRQRVARMHEAAAATRRMHGWA